MQEYGPATPLVDRLIDTAGSLTLDEAADLYRAYGAHFFVHGSAAERHALIRARRSASAVGLSAEYERARHEAVRRWRQSLPAEQGPWLLVGHAIANAAGALVVNTTLDHESFQELFGPWRQAMGTLMPVGPGTSPPSRTRVGGLIG